MKLTMWCCKRSQSNYYVILPGLVGFSLIARFVLNNIVSLHHTKEITNLIELYFLQTGKAIKVKWVSTIWLWMSTIKKEKNKNKQSKQPTNKQTKNKQTNKQTKTVKETFLIKHWHHFGRGFYSWTETNFWCCTINLKTTIFSLPKITVVWHV